jgi:hypothetical protein
MKRYLGFLLAALWLSTGWASSDAYDFPIDNKFLATVVGTPPEYRADLPEEIPLKKRSIEIFEDREVPEALWYDKKLRYSEALQKGPAPLVFLIAGTGAAYNGGKNVNMARAFYQAGFPDMPVRMQRISTGSWNGSGTS